MDFVPQVSLWQGRFSGLNQINVAFRLLSQKGNLQVEQ